MLSREGMGHYTLVASVISASIMIGVTIGAMIKESQFNIEEKQCTIPQKTPITCPLHLGTNCQMMYAQYVDTQNGKMMKKPVQYVEEI